MAHRGRLNVLAHMLHKPHEHILSEFEGAADDGRGDTEGDEATTWAIRMTT